MALKCGPPSHPGWLHPGKVPTQGPSDSGRSCPSSHPPGGPPHPPPPLHTFPVNLLLLQVGPETSVVQSHSGNKFVFPLITWIQMQKKMNWLEIGRLDEGQMNSGGVLKTVQSQNCSSVSKRQGFESKTLYFH